LPVWELRARSKRKQNWQGQKCNDSQKHGKLGFDRKADKAREKSVCHRGSDFCHRGGRSNERRKRKGKGKEKRI
jgi:hypothetical protein